MLGLTIHTLKLFHIMSGLTIYFRFICLLEFIVTVETDLGREKIRKIYFEKEINKNSSIPYIVCSTGFAFKLMAFI